MYDTEYYCQDCCETFGTEPPYHNEVKICPFCGSTDIISESQHRINEQVNADDEQAEEMRLTREARK